MKNVGEPIAHPKRFYKDVAAAPADGGGFMLMLDARTLRTPGGAVFSAPTMALAEASVAEWRAQGAHVIPSSMPVTQLAFAAIDWTAKSRNERAAYVAAYGETDLCCHRADAPAELVRRQAALWDPIVAWGKADLGVELPVVSGVIAAGVDVIALEALRDRAAALDDFRLTALTQATGLAGSALIGFAMLRRRLASAGAFEAAALDELWSLERWGEDEEARKRLDRMRVEFDALDLFIRALGV